MYKAHRHCAFYNLRIYLNLSHCFQYSVVCISESLETVLSKANISSSPVNILEAAFSYKKKYILSQQFYHRKH